MKTMDKSIIFLILSLGCFWLILDQIIGQKYVSQIITAIVPF